jgi:hypothetical protein
LENIEHSDEEVTEYAKYLGIDAENDPDLLWIAKAGLEEPLPDPWWVCRSVGSGHLFFFNPVTNLSVWEHPCDTKFRDLAAKMASERITVVLTLSVKPSTNRFARAVSLVGTKLSGAQIEVRVPHPGVTTFAQARKQFEQQLDLPENAVARLLLPDGTCANQNHNLLSISRLLNLERNWGSCFNAKAPRRGKVSLDGAISEDALYNGAHFIL